MPGPETSGISEPSLDQIEPLAEIAEPSVTELEEPEAMVPPMDVQQVEAEIEDTSLVEGRLEEVELEELTTAIEPFVVETSVEERVFIPEVSDSKGLEEESAEELSLVAEATEVESLEIESPLDEETEGSPFEFSASKPERVSMPVPVFLEDVAFDQVIPGWVEFEVSIDHDGWVSKAVVVGMSHEDLVAPAMDAISDARYTPVRDGNGNVVLALFTDRVEF